jgi:NAD(P)-dependent dehydrogenase (short-subunit alcohol dehydrogenase family)
MSPDSGSNDRSPLSGLAAFVTGGGSGIGLACARHLVRDGATVTIAGRSADRLAGAVAELESVAAAGASVHAVPCDVSDEESVQAAVAAASSHLGALHLCVASAGTGAASPLVRTTLDDWKSVLDTNLTGVFLTVKHAARAIGRSGGGSIVTISSLAGHVTHRFMAAYCASKAGVDMLTRVAADELGELGVRVNSVQPSLVDTELASVLTGTDAIRDDYLEQMPVSRVGTADDIGSLVRFLLGPESSWITGATIPIDGGHFLRRGPDYEPLVRMFYGDEAIEQMIPPEDA